jgi:hypothetical protein
MPLYSRKLHILVLRARTNCDTSLTILALSLGDRVVNHLASRLFMVREEQDPDIYHITYHFALPRKEN